MAKGFVKFMGAEAVSMADAVSKLQCLRRFYVSWFKE